MSRFAYYLPILGYHRVGPFRGDHVPTVSESTFAQQLEFLARRRYRVLGLAEVAALLEQGRPMPRHSTVITFDDGCEETASVAWPLLKRHGFSATVFVTPGEVGLKGFVTWEQIAAMSRDGVTIGSHTMHHSYLPLIAPERLEEELVGSKRAIEEKLQQPVEFISYPVGGFTKPVQEIVQRAGYRLACTTNRDSGVRPVDRYAVRRVKITEADRPPVRLLAKLSGYYDLFRRLKEPG